MKTALQYAGGAGRGAPRRASSSSCSASAAASSRTKSGAEAAPHASAPNAPSSTAEESTATFPPASARHTTLPRAGALASARAAGRGPAWRRSRTCGWYKLQPSVTSLRRSPPPSPTERRVLTRAARGRAGRDPSEDSTAWFRSSGSMRPSRACCRKVHFSISPAHARQAGRD
jgi:hypothetical protein